MIKIVTDSTSYLPSDLLHHHEITVVPLKVQFGVESYDEITGISSRDFYRRLATTPGFPTTSQPSLLEFKTAYETILARHPSAQILVLTLSSHLSGTYNSALTAATQLPGSSITVFDSRSTAPGLGLLCLAAAQLNVAGHDLAEIVGRLEALRQDNELVFAVDTLEYLRRGGRIGAAAAFLGTLLHTKPILHVVEGKVQPLTRVRTRKKAISQLLAELAQKLTPPDRPVWAGVVHIQAEEEMAALSEQVTAQFNVTYLFTGEIGPVVGAHLGPGAVGVGLCPAP
jgi:DegV family protein with EDD domain